ncbi:MAG: MlaD family protein [Chitinispirillales bacterium]|jgi:phospholipid/cholesterol/gamma-HCH transport system substrate-binding protein|nr:MlaD family protein [Chitinispirillales bacterium]
MGITAAQKFRLGIFVIIGMAILAAFIIIPVGMKMTQHRKTYVSIFEGESLQGLEQGAAVKFNGVAIGTVQRVTYNPEAINKMRVELSVMESFPMRVDMYATTGLIGITGLKYVEISGGSNEAALLKPGGTVPTRASLFASVGEKAELLIGKVETLLDHLNTVTTPDSLRSVKIALDNLAALTGDARGLFRSAGGVIPSVMTVIDTIQASVNEVHKITLDVKALTDTLKGGVSGANIPEIMAKADSAVTSVKTLTDNLSLMVMQTREDFSVSMENLREALESASQLMKMLADNPSLLIRGEGKERDNR